MSILNQKKGNPAFRSLTILQKKQYWPRLLGSTSFILLGFLVLSRIPYYPSAAGVWDDSFMDSLDAGMFEEVAVPLITKQAVIPQAPPKPVVSIEEPIISDEELLNADFIGLEGNAQESFGKLSLQPDTPVRVLTIVEPSLNPQNYPKQWRGLSVQIRLLIGLNGEILHSEIISEGLPTVDSKELYLQKLGDELKPTLSQWVFRSAEDNGEKVLSYSIQIFRLEALGGD